MGCVHPDMRRDVFLALVPEGVLLQYCVLYRSTTVPGSIGLKLFMEDDAILYKIQVHVPVP
jgi:hypothetical protein